MSSLLYLGFSIIAFLISYGIVFQLIPMILGPFFNVPVGYMSAEWLATRNTIETQVQFIAPIAMMAGLFIFVLKVLMVASVRGRD